MQPPLVIACPRPPAPTRDPLAADLRSAGVSSDRYSRRRCRVPRTAPWHCEARCATRCAGQGAGGRRLSLSIDAGRSSSATPLNPRILAPNSLRRSGRGGLVDQLAGLGEEPAGALGDLVHHALHDGVAHGLEGRRDDLTGTEDRVPDPLGGATRIADDVAQVTGRVEYPRTTAARNGRCPPAPVPARRDSAPW